jgi:uncharacterized OB-fold protein
MTDLEAIKTAHAEALAAGRLTFQRCSVCGHAWLPPSEECPSCLGTQHDWEDASGRARLVSWCTYHRTPLPEFENRLPYTVYLVELAEGPRLISGPAQPVEPSALAIEQPLELQIQQLEGRAVPRFL